MGGDPAPFRQLPDNPSRPARAFWTRADDGVRLRMAHWQASSDSRGSVLLFPGRTEYIEKYAGIAGSLNDAGYDVLAVDWRGQGLSGRLLPDVRLGHVAQFSDYQRDVVEIVVAATDMGLPRPWHLLAHSMGGCIGLAALHGGLPVTSAVFSAPMWGINLRQMPHGVAVGMAYLAGRLGRGGRPAPGSGAMGTYVLDESFSANLLTADADEWCRLVREAAAWPDLTLGGASFDWVGKALNECLRLSRLESPALPALAGLGGQEKVVSPAAIRDRMARWPGATLLEFAEARHEIMMGVPDHRAAFLSEALALYDRAAKEAP
ncbi:alpha/beta hydrolase [Paracoccus sediminis]|uniref:Alpha/beta hydrolase n=1 Tax=Paracoccus sediminis TaxID=1214787 RepID=A0A238X5C1_9RHOB|nr:alpha/beta hydrolase [Paracoccus sediminis]TBN49278.1 alpha/beta hydrolase [Paracoccus sediminis]SNR53059.1 lysophospholipase [Paracoccus sediminis]